MSPLHHAYLLKGWLLDKSPPEEVAEAVEAIIASLAERPISGSGEPLVIVPDQGAPEAGGEAADTEPETETHGEPEPKPRRKSNMSPENRAAAAERMRALQARKKAEREAAVSGGQPTPAFREPEQPQYEIRRAKAVSAPPPPKGPEAKPKPTPQIDPERLITVHRGYAGKREDGTLTDDDWPDIKARLSRREEVKAIASDYDASEEDLGFFIASCQRREGKSPGEALASPSSETSGAARRT